jgi:hypothetical protein
MYSLLGLIALESSFLTAKLNAEQQAHRLARREGEKQLRRVAAVLDDALPACQVPLQPIAALEKKSLAWWVNSSCVANADSYRFYYVIETLGENPCAFLDDSRVLTALYYRITLLVMPEKESSLKFFLQNILLVPRKASSACQGQGYSVRAGLQKLIEV